MIEVKKPGFNYQRLGKLVLTFVALVYKAALRNDVFTYSFLEQLFLKLP